MALLQLRFLAATCGNSKSNSTPNESARQVSLDEVMHAVESANVNAAGGFVVQGSMEWSVRGVGRVERGGPGPDRSRRSRGDTGVAGRYRGVREAPNTAWHRSPPRGKSSVRVAKQFGADTVQVAAGIRQALDGIQKIITPRGERAIVYDQSELVRRRLVA